MKLQARNFVVRKPETIDITMFFKKFCIATRTISHAVQQFYISQPSLTNAIRELEQEVGLALSKTESSVVSRTLLEYLRSTRQRKDAPQIK